VIIEKKKKKKRVCCVSLWYVNFKKHKKRRRQRKSRAAKTKINNFLIVFFNGLGVGRVLMRRTPTEQRGILYKISLSHILFASERDL